METNKQKKGKPNLKYRFQIFFLLNFFNFDVKKKKKIIAF